MNANITRTIGKITLWATKYKPQILVGTGIAAGVAATATACVATVKGVEVYKIYKETRRQIDEVHEVSKTDIEIAKQYSEEDYKRDVKRLVLATVLDYAKLAAVPVALGGVAVGCICGGTGILDARVASAERKAAEFALVSKTILDRVAAKYGEEEAENIRLGKETVTEEVTYIDEKGKEKKEKIEVVKVNPLETNVYGRFFDESSSIYCSNKAKCRDNIELCTANLEHIQSVLRWAEDTLHTRGYVYYNEVAVRLDLQGEDGYAGWILDPSIPADEQHVDIGLGTIDEVAKDPAKRAFFNKHEPVVYLDIMPNCLDIIGSIG